MTAFLLRNPRILLPFSHHPNAYFFSILTHPRPQPPLPPPPSPSSSTATSSTPIVSRRRFRSAIVSSSDPEQIFSMLHSSDLLLQNRETANLAVSKLASRGRRDLVEKLLEPVRSRSDIDERGRVRVMWLYSSAGMVDHALKTFDEMPSRTEKSFCALLGVFVDNHQPGRARECFKRVPEEIHIVPGISSWNLHLKALCDDGEIATAAELVLGKLQTENNIEPGIISHNVLLDACLKAGDQSGFDAIVEGITRKGLQQDVVTYNIRITMLCGNKNNNLSEAERLFDEMLSKGLKPNSVSYTTLLAGFCKNGELASAVRWFDKMQAKRMVDGGSYVMVLKLMVEKAEMSQAVNVCKECLGKKWAPPFDVIRTMVDGLVKDSMVKEARCVVEMMKECVKGPALMAWIKFESTLPL